MKRLPTVLLAILWLASAKPAPADDGSSPLEGGVLGGFVLVDEDLGGPDHRSYEPFLGGRLGYRFKPRWLAFGDLLGSGFETDSFRQDVVTLTGRAGLELSFPSRGESRWFLNGAAGYTEVRSDEPTVWSAVASAGAGQQVPVTESASLRWELRVDGWLAEDGLEGSTIIQPRFVMGLSWGAGRDRVDADADGVRDERDECPETPRGVRVDRRGCRTETKPVEQGRSPAEPSLAPEPDADGDGVPDRLDRCAKTLTGFEVDEEGCPIDRDRDGVYDGLGMDKCLDTPAGVPVDVHGCPLDVEPDGGKGG